MDGNPSYTYPEFVALFERLARDHGEFGYWEIDVAQRKTIEEMLKYKTVEIKLDTRAIPNVQRFRLKTVRKK